VQVKVSRPRKERTEGTGEIKREKKKEDKTKDDKKDEATEEPWWPPFTFDGRFALKSRLCLNLKNCQYDLFRKIALEELNWRVIDYRNRVIEKQPEAIENGKPAEEEEEEEDDSNKKSDSDEDKVEDSG